LTLEALEVKPLSQTRECVHLKEQPERPEHLPYKPAKIVTVRYQNQVIFKVYLTTVKIVTTTH
jgi:hypothetical protein